MAAAAVPYLEVLRAVLEGWLADLEAGTTWWALLASSLLAANLGVAVFCGFAWFVARFDRLGRGFLRVQGRVVHRMRWPLAATVAAYVAGGWVA